MRFIRKGGRVIPIRDKVDEQASHAYKKTAALTASAAATSNVARAVAIAGHGKSALGLAMVGTGLGLSSIVHQLNSSRAVAKASDGKRSRLGELVRHQGASFLGGAATNLAMAPIMKPLITGMVRGPMYAKKAVQALHAAVKPTTAAFADARKFKGAKKVVAEASTTSVARVYRKVHG